MLTPTVSPDLASKIFILIFFRLRGDSRKNSQDPNRRIQDFMRKGFQGMENDKGNTISKFASNRLDQFKNKLKGDESIDEHVKGVFNKDRLRKSKFSKDEEFSSIGRKRTLGEFRKPIKPLKPRDPSDLGSENDMRLYTEEEKTPIKVTKRTNRGKKKSGVPFQSNGDVDKSPKASPD